MLLLLSRGSFQVVQVKQVDYFITSAACLRSVMTKGFRGNRWRARGCLG